MGERDSYQQKLALVVLDLVAFFVALNGAIWLRYSAGLRFAKGGSAPWEEIFKAFPLVALAYLILLTAFGSYRIRQNAFEEISSVVRATLLMILAVLSATFFYREFSYSRAMILFFIPLVLLAVAVGRLGFRVLRRRALRRFGGRERIAVLGRSRIGRSLVESMRRDREYYDIVGYVDTGDENAVTMDVPRLGCVNEMERLCAEQVFDSLVLVDRALPEPIVLDTIDSCLRHQVHWSVIPAVHDLLLDRARVDLIDGIPVVGMRRSNIVGFNWMLKRITDIGVSLALLVLAAPVMFVAAAIIKLSSPGPVLYVHERVGYRGRLFPFLKFRSMHVGNDDAIHREYTKQWITENRPHTEAEDGNDVHKIVHDPRVFPFGRFIRRYSIDELPQLLNVLRGEMSLIGPRPAIPYEVDVYREWHRRRFEAPPGITGLWQVSGRNQLSFEEMIKLDIDYIENWSLLLDLRILIRTVRVVLFEHAY
jgi:exopolysaccharide biosynthesis polyprenyl glycosylphosphotransferase